MTSSASDISRQWHDQLFGIRRSIRYHNRRRAFFDRLDQFGNMLSVMLGSAAIYGVLDKDYHNVALIASALVTSVSAINLVIGTAQRARAHFDFARQFTTLEQQMLVPESMMVLAEITAARLDIEANEPPVLFVLDSMCHNELLRADGYPREDFVKIRWWQRLCSQVVDLREDLIRNPA
ncbi:MAG: hypothetical protein VB131_04550 [Burkholderia gladioli]